jgi:branched-chain amino acid transport system substrate-binding protein
MRKAVAVAAIATLATVAAACSSSSSGGNSPSGGSTSSPSSGGEIKIGVITSLTGSAASGFTGTEAGVKAAIGAANATGGINGHKITYEMLDDQSSAAGAAAAVRKAIQQDHDFAILSVSSDFFGAYKIASQAHEPVVGAGFDGGPEWNDIQSNPTMFDVFGGVDYAKVANTTGVALKMIGATKVGSVGYIESPSASEAAKAAVASAQAVGLAKGYLTNVHFGTTDVGPQVIGIKNSGTNGLVLPVVPSTGFAILGGLAQAGDHLKAAILLTGYGGDLLQSKQAVAAAQGDYFATVDAPAELNTPATKKLVHNLKTYAAYSGVPTFSQYQGYQTASAFLYGLGLAGANPTQAGFVSKLRVATWDANGLTRPVTFSNPGTIADAGGPGNCIYLPQLQGNKFVINKKLNPVCGKIVQGVTVSP